MKCLSNSNRLKQFFYFFYEMDIQISCAFLWVQSLKMLRHPNILRYIGAGKSSEGCFLVTEEVTPLASVLDKLSPLEVCAGLSDVLDALMFLHDKVRL